MLDFYWNEIKRVLRDNILAILVIILFIYMLFPRANFASRCIVVDVTGFTTYDSNEGTHLLALFERDGVSRRIEIPRKSSVEKGKLTIIVKESDEEGIIGYVYDEFSVCKDK
ncbi:MAG: hypothetical protein JXR16_12970 [Bermanella sp.]